MFEQEIAKKTICMWCHSHCPVGVYIKNGELDRVEEFKGHRHASFYRQVVRGCPRAKVAREWFYHPDRLNFPLKRIGEKGEAKWKRISWEQALDEIAAKLLEIKDKLGPEAVATSSGTYRTHDEYRVRFMNLFGSPNQIGQGHICYGPSNMMGAALVGWAINYVGVRPQAKCILIAGFNPEQSGRALWLNIVEAQRNGAKLIVIDPRRTVPAEKANLWLQLRPGTDTALYMAMINVIIEEKLYDEEFVEKWCFGFDRLVERAKEYPPEKAAGITWVAADLIKEAARTFATHKPALCYNMMGVEHLANCIEALHALTILPIITGNLDVKGGNLIRYPHPQFVSEFEIELNDKLSVGQKAKTIGQEQFKFNSWPNYEIILQNWKNAGVRPFGKSHNVFAHNPSVYRAMITGKPYSVRAVITVSSNPMVTQANTKLIYKALRSLDLYVVMDFWMTPSAELADYVLPAASWLERPHIHTQTDITSRVEAGVAAMPHQVEGKYDRRRDYDFFRGLGMRLGQEEYWPWDTLEEAYNYRLSGFGMTLEEFVEKKGGYDATPMEERKYEKAGFSTTTRKAEVYSTILEKLGYDPLPRYEEPPESPVSAPEMAKEFPLILITGGRFLPMYHSEHRQIESLRRQHPDPLLEIHPETARRLGFEDGDKVWIETPRGRIWQRCRYFEGIDPRVVHIEHGWWFPELPGEEPWLHGVWESNADVITDDDPKVCNKKSGGWPLRALLCKVYKLRTR